MSFAIEQPLFPTRNSSHYHCQCSRNFISISVVIILAFYLLTENIRFLPCNSTQQLRSESESHSSAYRSQQSSNLSQSSVHETPVDDKSYDPPNPLSFDEQKYGEIKIQESNVSNPLASEGNFSSVGKLIPDSSSVITQKAATSNILAKQKQYGTWIGNNWIPPSGKKIYSATEMKLFFQKHSVLWIGDSTARRAYNTLYGILSTNETHIPVKNIDTPALIDVNKGRNITEICKKPNTLLCRTVPGTSPKDFKFFDYRQINCYKDVAALAATKKIIGSITADYSLLIVSLGVWETRKKEDCAENKNDRTTASFPNSTHHRLTKALDAMCRIQGPSLTVVWRTSGFQDKDDTGNAYLQDFNKISMDHIDGFIKATNGNSNITYVDWGTEIWPRSNGEDRIKGDIEPHYGLEGRLLFLQLLMNELDIKKNSNN